MYKPEEHDFFAMDILYTTQIISKEFQYFPKPSSYQILQFCIRHFLCDSILPPLIPFFFCLVLSQFLRLPQIFSFLLKSTLQVKNYEVYRSFIQGRQFALGRHAWSMCTECVPYELLKIQIRMLSIELGVIKT